MISSTGSIGAQTKSVVQYMGKQILQCRQLILPISNCYLIKNLVRHFYKEVEIVVITQDSRDRNFKLSYVNICKHAKFLIQPVETNNNSPMWVKEEPKRINTQRLKGKDKNKQR